MINEFTEAVRVQMKRIDIDILNIDQVICSNIDLIDFKTVTRALVAQNLLSYSRNLVEHIAVKLYGNGKDIIVGLQTIKPAMEYLKKDNKYQFLRDFHGFLQESESHYTPENEGAERLALKYYQYYLLIRDFMKNQFQMDILHNLEKFPLDTDKSIQEYHEKIAERLNVTRPINDLTRAQRLYVHKVVPFISLDKVYFEVTLTPAYDTTSKFDRFVCYSSFWVPSHYSLKADIYYENIILNDKKMPINILVDYQVSIRPCELNNYASIFGYDIDIKASNAEYRGMMNYLSKSGTSLLEIVLSSDREYYRIKQEMFSRSQVHHFENVLDKSRKLILSDSDGATTIRYLLHTMNNKVIKNQLSDEENRYLSGLRLNYGCIPFDKMPFATSLIQHIPKNSVLFGSIEKNGRDCEFLVKFIQSNMNINSRLYTKESDIIERFPDVDKLISSFNAKLYRRKHWGRRIEKFGKNLYVAEAYDNTKNIIEKLQYCSQKGMQGYDRAISSWLEEQNDIDSEEKKDILLNMFNKSCMALIYGAAGTGKTYLINHISQFFGEYEKLFLANTNPAVENLKRKVQAQNCSFSTIKKYLMSQYIQTEYDLLIMDECSMVSNADMNAVLSKTKYKMMILVGDTYQIEAINFGNWFSFARYFIPKDAWWELENPYRTKDEGLLQLWRKVRLLESDLTEYIVSQRYSSRLDSTVFDKRSDDEIILCLNYDGLYGINNINRFLQNNNSNKAFRWNLWTFKIGDPILFNESERFTPILYNNLKGTIVNIEVDKFMEEIWFSIEVDKPLMAIDADNAGLELLGPLHSGKSVVRFKVKKKKESDDDRDFADDTDIPFQIAYAVSIHKAQGLEYDSVKVIITRDIDEMVTHNIFYTAITRSKKHLKIFWSPETMQNVIGKFEITNARNDANIFAAQSGIKMHKW